MIGYFRNLMHVFVMRIGFVKRQEGATLIEYALIISAIAVVVLLGSMAVTGDLQDFFNDLGGGLNASG